MIQYPNYSQITGSSENPQQHTLRGRPRTKGPSEMRSFRLLYSRSAELRELSRIWGVSQTMLLEDLIDMAYEFRKNRYFTLRTSLWVNQLRLRESILTEPISPTYHQEGDTLHIHVKVPTWLQPLRITKLKKLKPLSAASDTTEELRTMQQNMNDVYW